MNILTLTNVMMFDCKPVYLWEENTLIALEYLDFVNHTDGRKIGPYEITFDCFAKPSEFRKNSIIMKSLAFKKQE